MFKKFICGITVALLPILFIGCGNNKKVENDEKKPVENGVIEEVSKGDKPNEDKDKNETSPKKETAKVRLFYFDMEKMENFYVDEQVEIKDGAKATAITKAYQNYSNNENFVTLTKEVGVTKAILENGIIKIYLDKDFSKYMNLGSSGEGGLISGLVNTYGYNFKVDKVAIYCNNELYTGLRGELPEGYYTVDYSNIKEYKTK